LTTGGDRRKTALESVEIGNGEMPVKAWRFLTKTVAGADG
jgi:hypothetical protein